MSSAPRVAVRRDGTVAYVTLGTGERRNALTSSDWAMLARAFVAMAADDDLAAVVVRGAGSTFSAGSDIREWADASPLEVDRSFVCMERAFQAIEGLPAPVVAVVEGVAAGAGCQLALACDLQLVARSARLGMPIARLGILVTPAFSARLSALAGPAVARDLLYTGRFLSATEAAEAGLATRLVDDDALEAEVDALVASIARQPIVAVRAAKASVGALLAPLRASAAGMQAPVDYAEFARGVHDFLGSRVK